MAFLSTIRRWHKRDHVPIREISRCIGVSRNTIRKYLRSEVIEPKCRVPEIEGEVAMGGTAAWRHRRAPQTATLMRKLMAAGMINLGKTHTVEFAYGGWGTNQHLGTPRNPWDPSVHRTPGGSSSGSGVAVAARMTPWAIGTDTGGSVRIPAAWNGITGLKTTIGRVGTFGVLPLSPTLDTPGPITRDIEDAALLLSVLQGADTRDRRTLGVNNVDPMPTLRRGVKGLRLGRLPHEERGGIDAEVLAIDQNTTPAIFTRWVNFLDLCATAVPNGLTASGLPTSLQIICRAFAEPLALQIGYAYQTAHDWHLRVPPMVA